MVAEALAREFGSTPFELRYDAAGRCAVRVAGGGVLARHAEPPPAPGPLWTAHARCGRAAGWVVAKAAPADPARVAALLEEAVTRRTACVLERQVRELAALDAALIERLTHRLRTDVMTLSAVAEGALEGLFGAEAPADVLDELRRTSAEAQRRITAARQVMTVLAAGADASPEPLAGTLRDELEGAGRDRAAVAVAGGEEPWTRIGGAGWAACARLLAADGRWATFTIAPDAGGWCVTATSRAAGPDAVAGAPGGAARSLLAADPSGALLSAAHLVVAAGGHAELRRAENEPARMRLIVPAAPAPG